MPPLLGHLIDQLLCAAPLTRAKEGRIFLLAPHSSYSISDHHDALSALIREGLIHQFRYIDASPTPSIIAIRP